MCPFERFYLVDADYRVKGSGNQMMYESSQVLTPGGRGQVTELLGA